MRARDELTRSERREIEAALTSEIARMERVAIPSGAFAGEYIERSAWSDSVVSGETHIASPAALLQRNGHYQALSEALARLKTGNYGVCVYCGDSIPVARLLIIPETEHCLGCRGKTSRPRGSIRS